MGRLTRGAAKSAAHRSRVALFSAIWLLAACAVFAWNPVTAAAGWNVSGSGFARASAQTIPTAATPTAVVSNASVTVSWTATTLSGGTPAAGYVVRRYDTSNVQQTILANCTSVSTNSCVENNVPDGTWKYSVQATHGNWAGAEGTKSTNVVVLAATFSITASQRVRAGQTVSGGSLANFAASEAITFRLDSTSGTVLTGSIANVNASGAATGFTVTIPAGSGEGNHTIVAMGASGRIATSNTFLFDSVAPTHSFSIASAVAAYWSGTTLWFNPGSAGSFQMVDALADSSTGPASVTYPSFVATRWTATGGTVSTPAGGPYTSTTYSWTSGAATPANQTISGLDAVGNSAAYTWTFSADSSNPTMATADLRIAPISNTTTPGFIQQGGQYYVYANPGDVGSGVGSVTANVNTVTTGQTAVPLVAGSYTVGGVTYAWRSAVMTANATLTTGNKAYSATVTDRVGRSITSPNTNVVVDNAVPSASSISAPTNGSVVGASPTVSATSTDASAGVYSADIQFRTAGSGGWTSIGIDTTAPYSATWDTSALTQGGSYELRVVTTDNAMNTLTSASVTVTVDRVGPAAPSTPVLAAASDSGTLGDNITNDTTPTFTGTAEAGSTVRIFAGEVEFGSGTATGGNWSVTASALPSGLHSITATATDAAGNASVASAALSIQLDTTVPTIAPGDLRIAPIANTTTPGFVKQGGQYYVYANVTAEPGGSGVASVTANVANVTTGQTAVPLVAGSYTVAGVTYGYRSAAMTANAVLSPGAKTYTATATDAAANAVTTGTASVTVDNTVPSGLITAPASVAGPSATVTSSSADVTAGVYSAEFQYAPAASGSWVSITSDFLTPFSISWDTTALTDGGSYDLRVITTDNAGNTFTSPTVTITVDRTAPAAPSAPVLHASSDLGVAGDGLTNDTTPTLTGTAEAGATVTIYDGAAPVGTGIATGGNWSITTSVLAAGVRSLTATATDSAGNVSAASGALTLTIDATAPAPASVTMANGGVAATLDAGDTVTVVYTEQLDASSFCSAWTSNSAISSLTNVSIFVTEKADGNNDGLTLTTPSCTFRLAELYPGAYGKLNTFAGSTASWDPATSTLTITVGTWQGDGTLAVGVAQIQGRYLPSASVTDLAGNPLAATIFTSANTSGF